MAAFMSNPLDGMMNGQQVMSQMQQQGMSAAMPMMNMNGGYGSVPPDMYAHMYAPTHAFTRLQLNPLEMEYYQNLFQMADMEGMGYVSGGSGVQFLERSGLPREILQEVWDLADMNNFGYLGFEDFCVACRLVSHIQNGLPLSPEAVALEPPSLPSFDMTHGPLSDASGVDTFAGQGMINNGLGSMMDPNMAAASMGYELTNTPPLMTQSNPQASAGFWGGMTNGTDTQEYKIGTQDFAHFSNVFQMNDMNMDGYLEGMEARPLLETSGLAEPELFQIWALADADGDGRLSMPEFVTAMHLAALRKRGKPIPHTVPQELYTSIMAGGDPTADNAPAIPDLLTTGGPSFGAGSASQFAPPKQEEEVKTEEKDEWADLFGDTKTTKKKSKQKKKKSDESSEEDISFSDLVSDSKPRDSEFAIFDEIDFIDEEKKKKRREKRSQKCEVV